MRSVSTRSHQRRTPTAELRSRRRSGASTLDYVLVLGVILPLVFVVVPTGMRIIAGVFDMIAVTVSWPFL